MTPNSREDLLLVGRSFPRQRRCNTWKNGPAVAQALVSFSRRHAYFMDNRVSAFHVTQKAIQHPQCKRRTGLITSEFIYCPKGTTCHGITRSATHGMSNAPHKARYGTLGLVSIAPELNGTHPVAFPSSLRAPSICSYEFYRYISAT